MSRARSRLTHKPLHNDVARLDVVGNDIKPDKEKFLYTVNPDSGDFELLVVQAQEECEEAAVTWEQKPLTIGTPRVFRAAFWHYKGIPMDRRWDQKSYRWYDWLSIACRWVPAGVALAAVVSVKAFHSEYFLSAFITLTLHRLASPSLLQQASSGIQGSVRLCRAALQVVFLPTSGKEHLRE